MVKNTRRMVRWFPCQSNGRPPLAPILPNHPTMHRWWYESERSKCHLFWHFHAGNSSIKMRTNFISRCVKLFINLFGTKLLYEPGCSSLTQSLTGVTFFFKILFYYFTIQHLADNFIKYKTFGTFFTLNSNILFLSRIKSSIFFLYISVWVFDYPIVCLYANLMLPFFVCSKILGVRSVFFIP